MLLVDDDRFCGVTGLRGNKFPESHNSCFPNQGSQIGTTEITEREITISSKNKGTKIFFKTSKLCRADIHYIALAFSDEYRRARVSIIFQGFPII